MALLDAPLTRAHPPGGPRRQRRRQKPRLCSSRVQTPGGSGLSLTDLTDREGAGRWGEPGQRDLNTTAGRGRKAGLEVSRPPAAAGAAAWRPSRPSTATWQR